MSTQLGVTPERSGWRDARISARHRTWGPGLGLVDIDCLWVEYDSRAGSPIRAVGLVEYKHERAAHGPLNCANNRAVLDLAHRACLPLFVVTYSDDLTRFRVVPYGPEALQWITEPVDMTEEEYTNLLYYLRQQ